MSTQLIPVVASVIGNQSVQAVDGRALHIFLEVETRFNDWMDRRIEEYGFEENRDFYSFLSKTPQGGRPTKEYTLALDMAKELAMVERTSKGKEARQYFIECERRLYAESQPQPAVDPIAAQLSAFLKGKVIVDYEALCRLARMTRAGLEKIAAGEKLLEETEQIGLDLERQCGKPLIKFDIPAERLARHRAPPSPSPDHDAWEELVSAWLERRERADPHPKFTTNDVYKGAIHGESSRTVPPITRGDQVRLGRVLTRLGWQRKRCSSGGREYRYERALP